MNNNSIRPGMPSMVPVPGSEAQKKGMELRWKPTTRTMRNPGSVAAGTKCAIGVEREIPIMRSGVTKNKEVRQAWNNIHISFCLFFFLFLYFVSHT